MQKDVARGRLWNMLGSVMYGANSVLLLMFVSRLCGGEKTGVFGIAFTTAQMLWLVGLLGTNHYQMTDYTEQFSFVTYARQKLFSSLIMAMACAGAILVLGFTGEKAILTALLSLYMMAHSVAELFQSRLFQVNRLDLAGQTQFFRTLFSLACFAAMLYWKRDLLLASAVLGLSNMFAVWLFAILPCRPYMAHADHPKWKTVIQLTATCLPLFFSISMMNLLIQMPKYSIEFYDTDIMQGIFNILFMPAQVINLVSGFVYRPLLNRLSTFAQKGDKSGLVRLLRKEGMLVATFTVLCAAMAWLIGTQVLGLLFRTDLLAYRLPLLIIIIGGGVFAVCQLLYYVTLIFREQTKIFINYGACAAVFALLCPTLVRSYGILGASLGFVVIHIMLLCGYILIVGRSIRGMIHA